MLLKKKRKCARRLVGCDLRQSTAQTAKKGAINAQVKGISKAFCASSDKRSRRGAMKTQTKSTLRVFGTSLDKNSKRGAINAQVKGISKAFCASSDKRSRRGAMEILEVLIAVLMIVAIFALVVMMNTRFSSVIDTYMPFRMAVLVANRLSGSSDLAFTPPAGESAHKNLLSAAKLDNYVKNYNETMPPGSALLCFHWRASVKEPDTNGVWEFGHNTLADIPAQLLSSITSSPEEAYKSILENPINIFKFAYPATFLTENVLKDLIDMAPASYSLPVSVATDSGAVSCASAGGKCRMWDPVFGNCNSYEEPTSKKDCDATGGPGPCVAGPFEKCCCVKTGFAYVNKTGATMPAMLEVSVWKAKPECRDKAVIQKMLDEIKASAGG